MATGTRKGGGAVYLLLSVICLLGLLSEYAVLRCEQWAYAKSYNKFTITESIGHWVIVCFIWGILAAMMVYVSARVYGLNLTHKGNRPKITGFALVVLLLAVSVITRCAVYGGWKVALDFVNSGWFPFIFQYVYYFFEVFIVLLVVVFSQTAGEYFCEKLRVPAMKKVPWGAAFLALTWGLSHIVTQSGTSVELTYVMYALFAGVSYLAVNKNFYVSYAVFIIMFLI